MKRIFLILACAGVALLGACTSDSELPNPSGKGTIRAVNAIPGSPDIQFLIEERILGIIGYQEATTPVRFDDFEYNFNFDIRLPGETGSTRVATVLQKVDANRDHVFLLTGDPLNPDVSVVSADERQFADGSTVFAMRFAHAVQSLAAQDVDIYLDELVDPPVVVNRVATLTYGEISPAQDFEQGEYVFTITAAGDPGTVLYSSISSLFAPGSSHIAWAFDGDANNTGPVVLNVNSNSGIQRRLPDAAYPPTVRFVHASLPLTTVDIYDDDMLTSRIVSGLSHGEATGDIAVSGDTENYFWTPANSTATVLLQGGYVAQPGTHSNISVVGATDEWVYFSYLPDRASVSVFAKLSILQTSLDNELLDVYLLAADETIGEDDLPSVRSLFTPDLSAPLALQAGSYDLFVTVAGEQTAIAGPLRIDAANGDVVDVMILDTADPAVPALTLLPAP